jgi:predicted permease
MKIVPNFKLWLETDGKSVFVICAAMPTKITTFQIASKFGSDSEHVSIAILLSTLISVITTPIVLLSLGIL